jgi:hypothetical protein
VLFTPAASATDLPVGILLYDGAALGTAQFDIANTSGLNASASPDNTYPVTTPLSLSGLVLTVSFTSGPDEIFGSSYFSPTLDGFSFDGTPESTGSGQPNGFFGAISATLTGTFSTTSITLNDGTTVTIDPGFSAVLSDSPGLMEGDFGLINASTVAVVPPPPPPPPSALPEPGTWTLVGTGLVGLAGLTRRVGTSRGLKTIGVLTGRLRRPGIMLALCGMTFLIPLQAKASVKLNTWTAPSSGASGSTFVNVIGTGFPAGTILPGAVTLSLNTTCGGPGATVAPVTSVRHLIGTSDRLQFEIPALMPTGTYLISVSGSATDGTSFASSNCSEVQVTHTSATLAACLPSSSLAVLSGTSVTAYVPNGNWKSGSTGVRVVPIESGASATTIPTASVVNSCSSNSATGQTVCVANNTEVYEITGTTLNKTLYSSSNNSATFSGGSCENCGVAINALTNTAVIGMGRTGSSGDGIQILDLSTNIFAPAVSTATSISENMSVDPNRNLILSPNEGGVYDIFRISPTGGLTEYENAVSGGGFLDSAAEDCTTGIALSTIEGTAKVYIADLTQATFTLPSGGAPAGTWTAPQQVVNFAEFAGFAEGTTGISVAAGTTHLGIITGEFGGNSFGVFQLPSTSGSGTPSFVDYAAAVMPPPTLGGVPFSAGFDPHTVTAYTSPNNGRAFGLIADWSTGSPQYVGVIDLQLLLSAPRKGPHTVDPGYDLIANGVVRYVNAF